MSALWGLIVKEYRHITRDRRTMLILFGMPVIMLILFGFAIRNEVKEASFAVVDPSPDELTRELIQKLDASDHLRLVEVVEKRESVSRLFQKGRIYEAIVFEQNFTEQFITPSFANIQLILDGSNPNTAQIVGQYTRAIIYDFTGEYNISDHPAGLKPTVHMLYNPELESVNMFVPGLIAVLLMLVSTLMTSISITREKEMGSMEALLVSPLRSWQIILGKVAPYMALSFVNVLSVLILALLVFDIPFRGSIVLFLTESVLYILTALSLGVLISAVSNNQQTAMLIALAGLLLPTVMLSGFIFPISSMPEILQWISTIVPARWFLVMVRGIMLKGVGLTYLWFETIVLCGMMLLLVSVSMQRFKIRLEDA